jgi:methionyl-tRNA formyltransferase
MDIWRKLIMKKTSDTIVFFGSGPVAAASLKLLAQNFPVEAVVTKPRPFHHRGEVPVIKMAESLKLPVFTVTDKKALDKLFVTRPLSSKVAVLIDFGIIVSQTVIDYFPLGIINSHFSLLPELRGADPISFSILSGQKETGVSLMLLVSGMDEGPLLAQATCTLSDTITTPELTEELVDMSYKLLEAILPEYIEGRVLPFSQDASGQAPTYSRKLTKEDGYLDWTKPALQLQREIRAFAGWPKSRTSFGGIDVVMTTAHVVDVAGPPGDTTIIDKQPVVYCGTQALAIDRLKPAGKKEMTGEAFLAGYRQLFLKA